MTITKISFFTMLVTVGSAFSLIQGYGIGGGFVALLLGQILLGVDLWISFGKIVFSTVERQGVTLLGKDEDLKFSTPPNRWEPVTSTGTPCLERRTACARLAVNIQESVRLPWQGGSHAR